MAITRGLTVSENLVAFGGTGTDASISHTVDANTSLLMVSVLYPANVSVSGTPSWSLGGNLTLVDVAAGSVDASSRTAETWALVSPNTGAGTVTVTLSADPGIGFVTFATNYIGTETASVEAATNFLEEDINNGGTTTTVFASAGNAGNCLYAVGGFKGSDGDGITEPANFSELKDVQSGTSTGSDTAAYLCDQLDGAPDSCTWTWAANDRNSSHYLEIVAGAVNTTILVPTGPRR